MEYLNIEDIEDEKTQADPSPPTPPPLVVDSASGIYLGFDRALTDEEDDETDDETGVVIRCSLKVAEMALQCEACGPDLELYQRR